MFGHGDSVGVLMGACLVCGKKVRNTYCSPHRGAGKRNGQDVPCAECGVAFYRPAHLLERNKKHFCSKACLHKNGAVKPGDDGRVCSKCKTWKPRAAFSVEPRTRHGMAARCTDCENARSLAYTRENLELTRKTRRESARRAYAADPDKFRAKCKAARSDPEYRARINASAAASHRRRMAEDAQYAERTRQVRRDRRNRVSDREKVLAREKLRHAVYAGKVVRQPCEKCAAPFAHGHHDDYSKPLDVRWLCPACHIKEHRHVA